MGGFDHSLVAERFDRVDDDVGWHWASFGPAAPVEQSVPYPGEGVDGVGAEGCRAFAIEAFELHSELAHFEVCTSEHLAVGEGHRLDDLLAFPGGREFVGSLGDLVTCSPSLEALGLSELRVR